MPSASGLDVYETAYLCGGAQRVALTAVVAMQQDGRIKISSRRHRVQVVRRKASRPIENAVLDAVPDSGKVLSPAFANPRSATRWPADSQATQEPGIRPNRRLFRFLATRVSGGFKSLVTHPGAAAP